MAVIQFSGLVDQIRGKLNGSVLSRSGQGFVMYRKGNPGKSKSSGQLSKIAGFVANSNLYNSLTDLQRGSWQYNADNIQKFNRLGNLVNLNGYQFYHWIMDTCYPLGADSPLVPDETLNVPYSVSIITSEIEFSRSPAGAVLITLNLTLEVVGTTTGNNWIVVELSQPVPYPEYKYQQTWYRVGAFLRDDTLSIGNQFAIQFENILMPPGWAPKSLSDYITRVTPVNLPACRISGSVTGPATADSIPEYVEFPELSFLSSLSNSNFYPLGGGIEDISIRFDTVEVGQSYTAYNWVFSYRGRNLDNSNFEPNENTPISEWPVGSSLQPGNYLISASGSNNQTLKDFLNGLGVNWSQPVGTNYIMFTARLRNTNTGNIGPAYNIVVEKLVT
jgi:hypothetical protein